jgi:hypothetical protein
MLAFSTGKRSLDVDIKKVGISTVSTLLLNSFAGNISTISKLHKGRSLFIVARE